MITVKDLDDFIERKLGDRKGAEARELSICTEEEYFLFIKAAIRMTDDEADDCPFQMTLHKNPVEVKCNRFRIPNGLITRK